MIFYLCIQVPPQETQVLLGETDADESEHKYARRKNNTFLGKLIKAHEVHPRYSVSYLTQFKHQPYFNFRIL